MEDMQYSIDALSKLSGISIRNIRYYMQLELVNRPAGNRRNATYGAIHLEQLLTITKWQDAGLSLERIKKILRHEENEIPQPNREPGSITINSHIHLAKGVDLVIDAGLCELSSVEIRKIAKAVISLLPSTSTTNNTNS